MLSIILFLLKLIGILLAFIVLVILLMLVVPIRYLLYAQMDDNILAKGRLHYLFHIIQCKIEYSEKSIKIKALIFGFIVYDSTKVEEKALIKAKKLEIKEEKEKKLQQKKKANSHKKQSKLTNKELRTQKKSENVSVDKGVKKDGKKDLTKKEAVDKRILPESESLRDGNKIPKENKAPEKTQVPEIKQLQEIKQVPVKDKNSETNDVEYEKKGIFTKVCNIFRKIGKSILGIITLIKDFIQKQKSIIEQLKVKIQSILDKVKRIKEVVKKIKLFLKEDIHKDSLKHIFGYLKRFGKHIIPRKMKGEIEFGTDDPYETGKILAIVSSFYGFFGKHIKIYPNFEEQVLKGNVTLKGRIRIGTILYIVLRIYLYKNNRTLFKNAMKLKEEIYE